MTPPIFVCGVGRSGTSLLQSMLDAHPALALPPETHFFRRYVAPRRARARHERGGAARFRAVLAGDADFARAGLAPRDVAPDGPLDLRACYARLLSLYAARQGKPRAGDKDPRNLDCLAALFDAFPDAWVLHVVRDPRDVLLSRTKAAWSAARPWWLHALVCREQLRRGRALGRRLFGPRCLEVRYEELIGAPEETLRRVAAHVELDYDDAMLSFARSAARLVDERELAWKRETLGPLLRTNAGKWREGLSAVQIRWTEAVAGETLTELGYAPCDPPAPLRAGERALLCAAPLLRGSAALTYGVRGLIAGGER